MRPLGWVGLILIIAGAVVFAMGGIGYTKNRTDIEMGPIKVAAEEKGLIPPVAGIAAIVVGAVLVFAGRKRSA